MQAVDPLQPGSVLVGRYRLGPLLGSGGMAFVHRATDEVLRREVALKMLVPAASDSTELQRVRSEIDLLATLSHRALVTLFDAGSTTLDGRDVTYLVMELVDGPTLAARLALGPPPEPDVTRMAHDLAEALVVVHANGVVHRDLKPANILLAPSPLPGREFDAKLADFGIASLVDAARLTATGMVLGTAAYLSPEQATGARVGPSSDIYSLGLVLLESLTGQREFPGTMIESLSARLARDPVIPGSVGYAWKSLLTAMTARDPAARPTAAEVLDRLADVAGGAPLLVGAATATAAAMAPSSAPTAALPDRAEDTGSAATTADTAPALARRSPRRRPWALVGGVAAAFAILAAVVAFTLQGLPTAPATVAPTDSSVPAVAVTPPPATSEPAVVAPVVEDPVVEQPVVEQPVEEPVEEPVVNEPATNTGNNGNGGNGNGGGGNGNGNGGGSGNGNGGGNGGGGNGNGGGGGNGNGNG